MITRTWNPANRVTAAVERLAAAALILPFFCLTVTGCKTHPLSPYISPRITGRVVDSATLQPVQGVKVQRSSASQKDRTLQQPKGGEILQEPAPVVTGEDGSFVLESLRSLSPFRNGWFSVGVSFRHYGYQSFATNYTLVSATNNANGEPVITTGDIKLTPRKGQE